MELIKMIVYNHLIWIKEEYTKSIFKSSWLIPPIIPVNDLNMIKGIKLDKILK